MAKTKDQVRLEALEVLRKWKRGGAAISMGVGKTRLGLDHFQLVVNKVKKDENRPARGLVVAPVNNILDGWKKEAVKWSQEHLLPGLSYTTYRSLVKLNPDDYDVIYLDECQALKSSHARWLSRFDGYIIGLTGTPPKYANSEKGKLVNAFCPIRYEYLVRDAVDDKLLNDYEVIVHLLTLGQAKNHKVEVKNKEGKVTKFWYTSEQANYEYWTDALEEADKMSDIKRLSIMRMKAMQLYPTKEEYARRLFRDVKNRCILFANTQDQADRMCTHSYHANNKQSEENMKLFESGKIDKLSCVFQLAEGANIAGLKELIIMHAFGNNRSSAQRIGRGLRLDPTDKATIHILCFKNTIDVQWVKEALAALDQEKIIWYDPDIF